jgi:hypothetical protein
MFDDTEDEVAALSRKIKRDRQKRQSEKDRPKEQVTTKFTPKGED